MTFTKFVLAVLAIAFLVPSSAQADPPKMRARNNYKPMYFPEAPPPPPDAKVCRGTVLATLGQTQYALPRKLSTMYRVSPEKIITNDDPHHPGNDCTVKDLGTIIGFTTGFNAQDDVSMEVFLSGTNAPDGYPLATTYSRYKKSIDSAKADKAYVMFPGGMQKFGWTMTAAYLLPSKNSPTTNKEQVLVRCLLKEPASRTGVCNTAYFLPDDLFVAYSFAKQYFDEDTFPALDRKVRDRLEGMKVAKAAE